MQRSRKTVVDPNIWACYFSVKYRKVSLMKKPEDLIKGFQILAEKFKKLVETIDWVKIKQVLEYLTKQLPKDIENLFVELANRGWFIWVWDFDTPLKEVDKLSNLLGKCKEDQDYYIADYITSQIRAIEQELLIEYPGRKKQIEDSLKSISLNYIVHLCQH